MTSKSNVIVNDRDLAILAALSKTPLDAQQLLRISIAFPQPFTHERLVRRRLQALSTAGLVTTYQYATIGRGAVNYYKLTPVGFQVLNGPHADLPSRAFFQPVSMALQEHTRSLADFIVQTTASAHQTDHSLRIFYRENELRLTMDDEHMMPDCAFQLGNDDGDVLNYLVEIDNSTEPVYSTKQRDSLARKILFYDRYQYLIDHRFRVLMVFTKVTVRMHNFLSTVARLTPNKGRVLFYAVFLEDYLSSDCSLTGPMFLNHQNRLEAMIPGHGQYANQRPKHLEQPLPVW
jgi:hypothetical protein